MKCAPPARGRAAASQALGVSAPSHHVLVPSFTCAACADAIVHAGGVGAWLALPAIEARSSAVAIAPHAMLLAYMLRDLFWPLDAQIFAHHVICGILCYLSVSGHFPEMPPNLWMTGGFGLECGSLVVNVYRMRPQWRRFKRTAPWLMGASNMVGVTTVLYFAWAYDASLLTKACNPIVVVPLAYLRQKNANDEVREAERSDM